MSFHAWPARAVVFCVLISGSFTVTVAADVAPVYVHMNGANYFLESEVAVEPGQALVFVSQDTGGAHTIIGYSMQSGVPHGPINGTVQRTAGPGRAISTYTVRLNSVGIYTYYCSVHAVLAKTYAGQVQPAHRPGIDGFPGAMAGTIVVTHDQSLIRSNPATSRVRIISGFFGG